MFYIVPVCRTMVHTIECEMSHENAVHNTERLNVPTLHTSSEGKSSAKAKAL